MRRVFCIHVALVALVLIGPGGCGDATVEQPPPGRDPLIPAGIDCWETECGQTHANFCGPTALPMDFFEPGSLPFQGSVQLQGRTGTTDTQVRRHQDVTLNNPGDAATIPIEMVQLDLVSCQPITVMTITGATLWDVEVTLSDFGPQPLGSMTITKTHENGGTFESELMVQPKFVFTSGMSTRVLDTGDPMMPFPPDRLRILGEAPWVHELDPTAPGIYPPPCGSNFVPGVRQDPMTGLTCCEDVCHAGATATHCIVVGKDCSGCPDGACCFADGSCLVVSATMTMTAADVCTAMGGEYKGDGTSCTTDSDGDGIPDIKENNDCCGPKDLCNTGTNPSLPDSDGDGVPDGTEVTNGTDPCDPQDF